MTHENKKLRRQFAGRACEICPWIGRECNGPTECCHVIHSGMGAGRRLDVKYNVLSGCVFIHRADHNGNSYQGRRLREEELFEIVAIREELADDVDLQAVLWLILRLPKDATQAQMARSIALLPLVDRAVAWDTLREMGKA